VAGDHDYRGIRIDALEPGESLQSVDARQPDIEEHARVETLIERTQALFTGGDGSDAEAFVLEDAAQGLADAGLVIDYENRCRHWILSSLRSFFAFFASLREEYPAISLPPKLLAQRRKDAKKDRKEEA